MREHRVNIGIAALVLAGVAAAVGLTLSVEPERDEPASLSFEAPKRAKGGNPDAGEGARAKQEEGKVGQRAKGEKIEVKKMELDRQIADNSGLGGLIGSEVGEAVGIGGLGTKGTGMGGGGTGLGTGASGYGKGGGSFGEHYVPRAVASSEQYTDHGVNGFAISATDRVSTFSVDVDTGSYTISRRKLREGVLPPPAAVRVEEFVNYIDYAYAPPASSDTFAVHTELAVHPHALNRHLLRVGLKGRELPAANRPPVHLTFLVDVSGSMTHSDKLPLAQEALHYLVNNLGPEDTVALATYAGSQRRVLEPTPTTRAQAIHDAIDSLQSGGGTAMASGMTMAYEMASEVFLPGAENRVIVLSDGDANIGGSSHEQILQTIARHAGRGITLSTVGFGMGNYKDTLMEQLADEGDGNYAYVDSMAEARRVFGTDLAGTIRTIARDVKIQVEFDPASVHSYRLIGYENRDIADRDFRNDAVDAGEVGSGHQVTALYEIVLTDAPRDTIATVRLRAKPPGPDAAAVETAAPVAGRAVPFAAASADTRLAYGVATFAERLRGSPHAAEVSWDDLRREIERAADRGREDHRELIELVGRAEALSGAVLAGG